MFITCAWSDIHGICMICNHLSQALLERRCPATQNVMLVQNFAWSKFCYHDHTQGNDLLYVEVTCTSCTCYSNFSKGGICVHASGHILGTVCGIIRMWCSFDCVIYIQLWKKVYTLLSYEYSKEIVTFWISKDLAWSWTTLHELGSQALYQ